MAPKRADKRQQIAVAKSASAPAAKKAKAEAKPEPKPQTKATKTAPKPRPETKFNPIIDGIMHSQDLSGTCLQMLLAMIPHALGQASDERHHFHNVAVQMIGEALDAVAVRLQQDLDEQNVKLNQAVEFHDNLVLKLSELESVVIAAATAENDRKNELVEAEGKVAGAKAALVEKQSAQRSEDAALDAADSRKAAITEAFENHFKIIRDNGPEGSVAKTHYEAMLPTIKMLRLEESLITALPSTCMKSMGSRGAFDCMVLDQLGKTFSDQLSELTSLLEIGATARQERAHAVQAAMYHLEEAQKVSAEMAERFSAAQGTLKNANDEVAAARSRLQAHEPQRLELTKDRDAKARELEHFEQYNVGSYELLRDRVAKPPPCAVPMVADEIVVGDIAAQSAPAELVSETNAEDAEPAAHAPQTTAVEKESEKLVEGTPSKADIATQVLSSDAPVTVGGA